MHLLVSTSSTARICVVLFLLVAAAQAQTLRVNCNSKKGLTHISQAIKILQGDESHGSSTILVSGTCNENVVIQSLDNLTLTAQGGASINDSSGGNANVIDIGDSRRVSISGFTINGGANGVVCFDASLCRFSGNTVQGSANYGVIVNESQATFNGDTLQNNGGRGLSVIDRGTADAFGISVQGNGDGIVLNSGAYIVIGNSTIQNNQRFGILVSNHSTVRCLPCTITSNSNDGVRLQKESEGHFDFGGNTLTGNGGAGVTLLDLSFASFDPGDVITGNLGGTDVVCNPQFSATRGARTNIGGGTTNCTEP
jgi:Right handed beta helix region